MSGRFELHVDKDVVISSNPDGEGSCWYPAVFPLSELGRDEALVKTGSAVSVRATTVSDCLTVSLHRHRHRKQCEEMEDNFLSMSSDLQELSSCTCSYVPPQHSLTSTVLSDSTFYLKTQEIYRYLFILRCQVDWNFFLPVSLIDY